MDFNFYMTQATGIVAMILAMASMPLKKMKPILILQLLVNLSTTVGYLFSDGFSGAWICIIAMVQTVLCYLFDQIQKKFPLPLAILFMLGYVACSLLHFHSLFDILPAAAAIAYALSILTPYPAVFRIYNAANCALWIAYDLSTAAYTTGLLHILLLIVSVVSILRLDREDWKRFFSRYQKKTDA